MKPAEMSSFTDHKQVLLIISSLNVLKMNIGMYPDGHAGVDKSADRAYTLIRECLQERPEINIGVTDETLLFNEKVLDKNNKNFQEYAHILSMFRIILLKLKSSVIRHELFHFSKILSSRPSDIRHTNPETIASNITPFILSGKDATEAAKFLILCGGQNVPWLFDLYLDQSTAACNTLIGILKGFGAKAVEEANQRMAPETPLKALRLLALLRGINNESVVPLLKELYDYDDYSVKKEVIAILLDFKHPDAVNLLRKSLHSRSHREIHQAVSLTVLYEISLLMSELISLLKTFYIREKDTILNELIVRQLGGSGSSWAIPYMEMITAIRLTLSPQHLFRLKEILYESLENFPPNDVRLLMERGSKSWNRKIRESCRKLMSQKDS